MRRLRNVKIVATLGPASSTYEMIRALFEAGADVFRLNMSHGSHEDFMSRHKIIRQIEEDTGRPIAILADLQGPKLRVGTFADWCCRTEGRPGVPLRPGRGQRRCHPRHPAAQRDFRRAGAGRAPAGQRRQDPHEGRGLRQRFRQLHGDRGRHDLEPQGRQRARRGAAACRADRKGPQGPGVRLRDWASTGWRCRSCSAPRMSRRPARWSRAAPRSCPRSKNPQR